MPALISLNTHSSSRQWQNVLALGPKFPGLMPLLTSRQLGLDSDLMRAAGPEVDIVFLDFRNGGNDVVALTRPKSKTRLLAALKKNDAAESDHPRVTGEVEGWTVIADSRAKIAAFRRTARSGERLADLGAFKDAMSRLDDASGVRAYVAGEPVQEWLDRALARIGAPPNATRALVARLESISGDARARSTEIEFDSALSSDPVASPKTAAPTLAENLPGGGLLYLSTVDLASPLQTFLHVVFRIDSGTGMDLRFLSFLVLGLNNDVTPLLAGEQAFALYAQTPVPKVVLALKGPDESRAEKAGARYVELFKSSGAFRLSSFDIDGVHVTDVTQPGIRTHAYLAVTHGELIVSTSRDLLPALIEGKGPRLADDPLYKRARVEAKVPEKVAGLVYGDLVHGLPFAFDLAERKRIVVPGAVRANTKPLGHVLLYAHQDGKRFLVSGFVSIK